MATSSSSGRPAPRGPRASDTLTATPQSMQAGRRWLALLALLGSCSTGSRRATDTEAPRPNTAVPNTAVPTAATNAVAVPAPGPTALEPGTPLPAPQRQWVESTLSSLSLRERVAQMMMVWVLGDYSASSDPAFRTLVAQVEQLGIGGVVMSLGSPIEVAAKLNYLQARSAVPLLVASDVEPGLGRLEGGVFSTSPLSAGTATVLPSNMAIGAGGVEADAEMAGRITGLEARAVGIHLAFAPTADVNNNPDNPVINTRSFGEVPTNVSRLTAAFVRGLQASGAAATLKHFPGHGDTDVDSHLGLPVITVNRERLDAVELQPFRSGIAAGAAAVMTAHIALPLAYGDSTPATLSSAVMTGLLRDTLGFTGLTVTDAMTMDGIAKGYGVGESAVRAVHAGVDVILMPGDLPVAIEAIVRAVETGQLPRARIDASVRRILELKVRTGAAAAPQVSLNTLRETVGRAEHQAAANGIAERAITLLRQRASALPLTAASSPLLVVYAPDSDLEAGESFAAELATAVPTTHVVRVTPRTGAAELDALATRAQAAEHVVVFTYTRTLEGKGRFAIAPRVAAIIESLAQRANLIVVAAGNPYVIKQFPSVSTYLVTYGRGKALEVAAARALSGRAPISGHSPVSLPGFFTVGDGIALPRAGTTRP